VVPHVLEVEAQPEAVPAARRFVAVALAGLGSPDVVDAAELVVTELLTNALLHGAAPVRLLVAIGVPGETARIEVHDGSRVLPVRTLGGVEGMTGRGLSLVDAVAADWGVDPTPDGKLVWAELTPDSVRGAEPGDVDLDLLLASFPDEELSGPVRYTVTLGDVPTDLLLSAKAHVDSVVRELTLTAVGAESGVTAAVPIALSTLLHDVVNEFAEARQAIKRQALASAALGEQRTRLSLTLPAEAADAGLRYLAALEEADAYGRSSRLLTLAAPPQHQAFRRWYVTSLVQGLRAAAKGGTAFAPSFESHLLGVVDHLAELQKVSERGARLQRLTSALAGTLDRESLTAITVAEATGELGAARVALQLHPVEGVLVAPEEDVLTRSVRVSGQPAWIESREQRARDFPELAALQPDVVSVCAVPLLVGGHGVGVLRLSFREPRLFVEDERAFVLAMAAVAAQAVERADLYAAYGRTVDRLRQLQSVTAALATTRSVEEVLDVALEHGAALVGAEVASISLLSEDGRTLALARVHPARLPDPRWDSFSVSEDVPAAEAVREGRLLWVSARAERDLRWPAVADLARGENEQAFTALPLNAEGTCLGALTMSFPVEQDQPAVPEEFLRAFADACGQALQRTRAADAAQTALRRLAFLAGASEELAGTLDIETTLARVARLAVPEVADYCMVHLLQDGELACVAVEHVDAERRAQAVALQQRWPERLEGQAVGRVVRTGEPLLLPELLGLSGSATPSEQERMVALEAIGLRSVVVAPLTARGRTLGALTLLTAQSGRTYGPADLVFVQDLARRAALAVDNARLHAVGEPDAVPVPVPALAPVLLERPRPELLPRQADGGPRG